MKTKYQPQPWYIYSLECSMVLEPKKISMYPLKSVVDDAVQILLRRG